MEDVQDPRLSSLLFPISSVSHSQERPFLHWVSCLSFSSHYTKALLPIPKQNKTNTLRKKSGGGRTAFQKGPNVIGRFCQLMVHLCPPTQCKGHGPERQPTRVSRSRSLRVPACGSQTGPQLPGDFSFLFSPGELLQRIPCTQTGGLLSLRRIMQPISIYWAYAVGPGLT